MRIRLPLLILAFALAAVVGYWLSRWETPVPATTGDAGPAAREPSRLVDGPMPKFRRAIRAEDEDLKHNDGSLGGERILVFKDQAALERFLKKAGSNIRILDRLDALHALRIGFSNPSDLAGISDEIDQSLIFPVFTPAPKEGGIQDGAVAMGRDLLKWLGISADHSNWGKGVTVAILDTGVTSNPAFASSIRVLNLIDPPTDPSLQNGHGTAVASMIIGNNPLTPGVAPGADILSIRIADDQGISDTFLLAKGIIAAADAGAGLINISMGSFGDSPLVREAIDYATSKGSLIFAAAGNNGIDEISYPAAYPNVVAVGAVDGVGNLMDFSNRGSTLDMTAPGYAINAAWSGDQAVSVTGTSFSTPIVVGSTAALMSQFGLSPQEAVQRLAQYANDGGAPGVDSGYGVGMTDLGRAMAGNTPGIYDAAVASSRYLPPDAGNPNGQIEVLVQNRGTEMLVNASVAVNNGSGNIVRNITSLAPNAVTTVRVPVNRPIGDGITVDSRVTLGGGVQDVKPANDRRSETYAPSTSH